MSVPVVLSYNTAYRKDPISPVTEVNVTALPAKLSVPVEFVAPVLPTVAPAVVYPLPFATSDMRPVITVYVSSATTGVALNRAILNVSEDQFTVPLDSASVYLLNLLGVRAISYSRRCRGARAPHQLSDVVLSPDQARHGRPAPPRGGGRGRGREASEE